VSFETLIISTSYTKKATVATYRNNCVWLATTVGIALGAHPQRWTYHGERWGFRSPYREKSQLGLPSDVLYPPAGRAWEGRTRTVPVSLVEPRSSCARDTSACPFCSPRALPGPFSEGLSGGLM
jgi:hypothetical protein